MPLFQFECAECGHVTEVILPMDSETDRECPMCGSLRLCKVWSDFTFRVRGFNAENGYSKRGK